MSNARSCCATGRSGPPSDGGAPWRTGDGAIAGSVAIVHDITEAEGSRSCATPGTGVLRECDRCIPGVFFVLDRQGKYVRWNRNLETLLDLPPEQIAQRDALATFYPEDRQRWWTA